MYPVKGVAERMMRVGRQQVTENRRTIVEAAGRLFRERGFDSVTVAEIMKAAGLTHGGFYGYFRSKDELIAEALAEALTRTTTGPLGELATYAAEYLSRSHRNDLAGGCPTAALAAETMRQTSGARTEMTVGAMILARASDDPALSDEVLDQTRVWLEAKTKDRRQHNSRNRSTKDCRLTKG